MKQTFISTICLIALFSSCMTQKSVTIAPQKLDEITVYKKYDELVQKRQYAKAMLMLEKQDPNNENPEMVARKLELIVNYQTLCNYNQHLFGFRDLQEGQTLDDIRIPTIPHQLSDPFDVMMIMEKLLPKHPSNSYLARSWAEFRFYGLCGYGQNGEAAYTFYTLTEKLGGMNAKAHHNLAFIQMQVNKIPEAKENYKKALAFQPNYPEVYYNMANLSFNQKDYKPAAKQAIKAYELYGKKELQSEAAVLAALSLAYDNQKKEARQYAHIAYEGISNNEKYIVLRCIAVYLLLKDFTDAHKMAGHYLAIEPDSINVLNTLLEEYAARDCLKEFLVFADDSMKTYKENAIAMANLHYQKATVYRHFDDTKKAIDSFKKARQILVKQGTQYEPAVEIIDRFIKNNTQ